jgi:membrane-associated protein
MDEFWNLLQVLVNPLNGEKFLEAMSQPGVMITAFIVLNMIVFTETGLLIGFFLPGDSLLITAGIAAASAEWNVPVLIVTLCISAIIGDTVGYTIGRKSGPKLFKREQSFFFRKDHLLAAQTFYEVHGGKTIILARFMPFIRTFAPVVAGIGQMQYRRFLFYNIFGGIGWVVSMILSGYFLPDLLNPLLSKVFGRDIKVERNLEKVIILVIALSVLPIIIKGFKVWLGRKKTTPIEQPTNPSVES